MEINLHLLLPVLMMSFWKLFLLFFEKNISTPRAKTTLARTFIYTLPWNLLRKTNNLASNNFRSRANDMI